MKCLYAVLSVLLLSCSSLPPVQELPDSSSEVVRYEMSENERNNFLKTITNLRRQLENLKKVLKSLKKSTGNLRPLIDSFEKQLTALQDINERLKQELTIASGSLIELSTELEALRQDFEDYRKSVEASELKAGFIGGGIGAAIGAAIVLTIFSIVR